MKIVYLLIAVLGMVAPFAHALDSRLVSGTYLRVEYNQYGNFRDAIPRLLAESERETPVTFDLEIGKDTLTVVDLKHRVRYKLDFANPGEQELPKEFYQIIKTNEYVQGLTQLIEKITISELRNSGTEVTGRVNLYIRSTPNSGFTRLKFSIPGRISATDIEGSSYDYMTGTYKPVTAFALMMEVKGKVRVDAIETSMPSVDRLARSVVQTFIDVTFFANVGQGTLFMPKAGKK